ncbi:wd40 repeat protein [Holotrichia oblita]|uniref:Wd40 repeat protein n=1 Tax=Holotrichia oblita TaxID=644536 RepID=A0ACB9TES4_HOLOL|nr:wd40 repeat protein [Holotrichia oblita]
MEFAQPPPTMAGSSIGIPNMSLPPPNMNGQGFTSNNRPQFRPFLNVARPLPGSLGTMTLEDFDGKRLRKSVMRKTVDYNSAIIKELENRVWQRDYRDRRALQPDVMYYPDMMPPPSYPDNPINCVTTRFVKTATNKMRCPIFCMAWTPEGRRLVTGASSGEFTLWNGLTFNFETILQINNNPFNSTRQVANTIDAAHHAKIWRLLRKNNYKCYKIHVSHALLPGDTERRLEWCHWLSNRDSNFLNNIIWTDERHGADVKCVHWHPQKGLVISGSKDNQQPIKLWDPKTGQSLATLHAHKSTVMDLKWNENGNWLITASRDHLLKLFDLRNLSQEVQTFRGHKKEASSVAWHPHHEGLFCSGGSDGSIMFWHVGADKEVGAIEQAHDSIVWTLAWHPLGHILCSGSNDHTSKFWTRNRPGDLMRDKYNLNTLPAGIAGLEDVDMDEPSVIPGMGPEDKVDSSLSAEGNTAIPGLDLDIFSNNADDKTKAKKVPYSKPIPRNFQAQWNETGEDESAISEVISQIVENTPGVVPLQKIAPNAIIIYGKLIPVEAGSKLEAAIAEGPEALQKFIDSGQIEELHDVMPHNDEHDYLNDAYIDDEDNADGNGHNADHRPAQNWDDFRDSDMRNMDQDMRQVHHFGNTPNDLFNTGGDVDHRNIINQDVDFRNQRDFDMRNASSDDYQISPYDRDPEYEDYEQENEYGDDYYVDNRNWQKNNKYNRNFQENTNQQGNSYNRNFRQNASFNRNDNQYQQDNQNWNGPNEGGSFRSRGNYRGGSRGGRGYGGNKGNTWNNRSTQGSRGGARGGSSRGRY